jgi:hypothetical protein
VDPGLQVLLYIQLVRPWNETNEAIGSGSGQWSAAYTKAKALVAQMTLVEKVRFPGSH